jgi:mono/diheme cytochrome c family protein
MRRLDLCLLVSGVLVFAACGSSKPSGTGKAGSGGKAGSSGAGTGGAGTGGAGTGGAGTGGSKAGADGGAGTGGATTDGGDAPTEAGDGPTDAVVLTGSEQRGQYLVNNVLGCPGCHTPKAVDGGTPGLLSGVDCFAKDTATNGCLASANLTADDTGIANLTDQQVKDAFTKGIFPMEVDGGTAYLFANMPYYQFATLTDADANAIVAYLRTLTPVQHAAPAPTGAFAARPTAAQWTPVTLAQLPSPAAADGGADGGADAGGDGGAPSPANGKYMAALMCSVCHTVNTSATSPLMLDPAKAFQGGKEFTTTVTVPIDGGTDAGDGGTDAGDGGTDAATTMMVSKKIQSANLTPDTTGLKLWTAQQILTAIKSGKDEAGRAICSPMRPFPGLTDSDALDIASYLQAIPAVTNAITETCE